METIINFLAIIRIEPMYLSSVNAEKFKKTSLILQIYSKRG